jgi:hypothetical protein
MAIVWPFRDEGHIVIIGSSFTTPLPVSGTNFGSGYAADLNDQSISISLRFRSSLPLSFLVVVPGIARWSNCCSSCFMSVTAHQYRRADNLHDRPAKWPCPLAMGCRMSDVVRSETRRDDGFRLEFERLALFIKDLQALSNRFFRGGLFRCCCLLLRWYFRLP